jgi:hypothetical protein
MIARHVILLILFQALIAGATETPAGCASCVEIAIEVTAVSKSPGKPAVGVRLTNRGRDTLKIRFGEGPWLDRLKLVAIDLPTGDPIPSGSKALVNPAPEIIELKPGESEAHAVALDEFYPELASELRRGSREIMLYWTFQLVTEDRRSSERLAGWIQFKASAKNGTCPKPERALPRAQLLSHAKEAITGREGKRSFGSFDVIWHEGDCGWLVTAHLLPKSFQSDRFLMISNDSQLKYYAP